MGEVFVTPPAAEGAFAAAGRVIDEWIAAVSEAFGHLAQLLADAEEYAEHGRNPYTALAAIEARVVADADTKFAEAQARLLRDSALERMPDGHLLDTHHRTRLISGLTIVTPANGLRPILGIDHV
jgi:alkanesulfonate monooxygenase SsuD/methylene tetrahydromethanopterin reductase-like flavin-dependent oxidoreductase (luciferase family)